MKGTINLNRKRKKKSLRSHILSLVILKLILSILSSYSKKSEENEEKMKNMKERVLRKLKTISTSRVFQTSTDIVENLNEEKLVSAGPNYANGQGNFVHSVRSKLVATESKTDRFAVFPMQETVQLLQEADPSIKVTEKSPSESMKAMEEKESIILYTTSLRGIRKTFKDCNTIRFLLESFRVVYYERDVSMHLEYRDEVWSMLGGRVVPPKLFIKGKYIGGADEVVQLHEKGNLKDLLQGIPLRTSLNYPCKGCANMRFIVCSSCNGSRKKLIEGQEDGVFRKCCDCNENGLVKCSFCML